MINKTKSKGGRVMCDCAWCGKNKQAAIVAVWANDDRFRTHVCNYGVCKTCAKKPDKEQTVEICECRLLKNYPEIESKISQDALLLIETMFDA